MTPRRVHQSFTRLRRVAGRGRLEDDLCTEALCALTGHRLSCWRDSVHARPTHLKIWGHTTTVRWVVRALAWAFRASLQSIQIRASTGNGPYVFATLRLAINPPGGTQFNTVELEFERGEAERLAASYNTARGWNLSRWGIGRFRRIRRSCRRDLDHQPLQRRELAGAA